MKEFNKYNALNLKSINIKEMLGNAILTIEPGSLCTFDREVPSNGRHFHNCFELCIVINGSGHFIHGGTVYYINKSDIFIANPRVIHEITTITQKKEQTILELFYFSLNIVCDALNNNKIYEENILSKFLQNHCNVSHSQPQIITYLNFMQNYMNCKPSEDFGIQQALKNIVLDSLLLFTINTDNNTLSEYTISNILDLAIKYIGTHLTEKITLEEIALYCNTSIRNLQYHFKKHLNTNTMDYINKRRMSLASGFIRMNYKISDIGIKVGIDDPSQFCRVFKKYYGLSPKQYQMKYSLNGMAFGAEYTS